MLPSYFNYIIVHLRQKARLRPELSPKLSSTLGPKPARTRLEPDPKSPARLTTLLLLANFSQIVSIVFMKLRNGKPFKQNFGQKGPKY